MASFYFCARKQIINRRARSHNKSVGQRWLKMVDNQNYSERRNATPVASVKQLKEARMKISTVEALKAEGKEIVNLSFNRDVTEKTPHVKRLAKSIKEEGLHTLLHLVPATTALKEGIELLDENGSAVTDGENKLTLVDGNNKFKAILMLRKSGDPGKAVEPIKCIVDEDAKDIQRMVMTMNNVVKTWNDADAIKAASKTKSNETIEFIKEKVKEGFTFSTLSLILLGQKGKITKDVIMKYISGTGELPKCNIAIAKKKLEAMKEVGFSDKFIKNRFPYEAVIKAVNEGHTLYDILEALKKFTPDEVQFAEDRRDLSLLEDKLAEVVEAKND